MEAKNRYGKIIIFRGKQALDYVFDYSIDETMDVQVGMRVKVPFGKNNQLHLGYIIDITNTTELKAGQIKKIAAIIDTEPIISANFIKLAYFLSEKYFTSLPQSLLTMIPSSLQGKVEKPLEKRLLTASLKNVPELAAEKAQETKRKDVILYLEKHQKASLVDIQKDLHISASPIYTLEKKGILEITNELIVRDVYTKSLEEKNHPLTTEQQFVLDSLLKAVEAGNNKPVLLHGVTGSGKTEIYLKIIEKILSDGKEAIVLVPEIALTPQLTGRFKARFGEKISFTHSRLSEGERLDQWRKARNGDIQIMIGPRSAIFSPFKNLGMVIIDEEHESTYQGDQNPKYDTRMVAKKLCELSKAHLILGTATPALETFYGSETGALQVLSLTQRAVSKMPQVYIADMRQELRDGNKTIFSRLLYQYTNEALNNQEQVILFLNRRGHSTFISCRQCGDVLSCPHCDVNFTYHQATEKLICHYCGQEAVVPRICSSCGSPQVKFFGLGTQKLEAEIYKYFPQAKVLRMDYDTTRKKGSHQAIYTKFLNQGANVLIGTQMIAKGLDFPHVTVVGAIAADMSLYTGDFRSSERTFQLISQVAGRAGRRKKQGNVVIQTYSPEHFVFETAKNHDYLSFYKEEIILRKKMNYPPFSHLFSVLLLSPDEKSLIQTAFSLGETLKAENEKKDFEILGPAPAYISKIRNDFRWQLLIKGKKESDLRDFVVKTVEKAQKKLSKQVRIQLTINPQNIV